MKKILAFVLTLFSVNLQAQQQVEMADQLRSDGKIYVVVAVVSIILLGILLYLIRMDVKITRLTSYKCIVNKLAKCKLSS